MSIATDPRGVLGRRPHPECSGDGPRDPSEPDGAPCRRWGRRNSLSLPSSLKRNTRLTNRLQPLLHVFRQATLEYGTKPGLRRRRVPRRGGLRGRGAATAGLFAGVIGATVVVFGTGLPSSLWPVILRIWSVGDAAGIIVILPFILHWWCSPTEAPSCSLPINAISEFKPPTGAT